MSKQLGVALLGLVVVGAIVYFLSSNKKSPSSSSPSSPNYTGYSSTGSKSTASSGSDTPSVSVPTDVTLQTGNASTSTGKASIAALAKANPANVTNYKGKQVLTQAGQVAGIKAIEGENTKVETNYGGDPLLVKYSLVGGGSAISARPASSSAENIAARKANAQQMAAFDPSYTKTEAYQRTMSL